jgi:aspartokinase/homoserine dehydrogenase 1
MPTPQQSAWVVHKFGGSSLADADCFRRVARILASQPPGPLGVVLSASRGVTDALLELPVLAERHDAGLPARIDGLRDRHAAMATELLDADAARRYLATLVSDLNDIVGLLQAVRLTRTASPQIVDLISGFGEIWSTRLFREYFAQLGERPGEVRWVDARGVVVVEWGPLGPAVQWAESRARLVQVVPPSGFAGTLIIPGFVASDARGVQTTLGRNGSDFSASIFGALLDAREIHIWTDVDGVLSADPRRVPDARVIDSLSYNEAMELAYFGAKVIHPQTMAPAIGGKIPIWIRNTFAPDRPATLIGPRSTSDLPVKGITTIEKVALVNLEGAGMIGVPGTAHRLFGALREEGISVILISQGSSEHSICCAVPLDQAERAVRAIKAAFARELDGGQIQAVAVDPDLAILAVVGDGMAGTPGIAAKLFQALGGASVNVRAIAQGASERNISVVVDGRQTTRALQAVHAGFYLSPNTISIGLIGPGTVGRVLLDQLASQRERLQREFHLDLRVRAIQSSRHLLRSDRGIDLAHWRAELAGATAPASLEAFVDHVHVDYLPHTLIVDCTASPEVAGHYREWLAAGIHVVTPNKRANSGPLAEYRALHDARRQSGTHYLYEATVGAGLPIIQTLRDLRETGDDILSIEGILSGTLAYLFNVYDGDTPFSAIVRDARQKGYTEPDPRDDLSGMDVARKLIIMAREMGLALELGDVAVESLVPAGLDGGTIAEFLDRLPMFDAAMHERLASATARGKVLRYIGRVGTDGHASVGLREVDRGHAFANIALTDNVVRFQTRRYSSNPLVVQGPGAGPEVTAGGAFADILRLASYLGTRL